MAKLKFLLICGIFLLTPTGVTLYQDSSPINAILGPRFRDPMNIPEEKQVQVNNATLPLLQNPKKRFDPLLRIPMTASTAIPGNLYSSLSHMNSLFAFDKLVGPAAKMISNPSQDIKSYLAHYKYLKQDLAKSNSEDIPESITGNPLHVYALIKRLVQFGKAVFTELNAKRKYNNSDLDAATASVEAARKVITLPTIEDFSGAGLALSRLAHVYRLNIDHMTKGFLQNVHSSVRLSGLDCLHISIESLYMGQYTSAYVWNEQAIKLTEDPELRSIMTSHLNKIILKHDENWKVNEFFFPKRLSVSRTQEIYDTPWNRLCRGMQLLNASVVSTLFCYINDRGNPYLKLMPVKYEQLHHDPELYMFYDMISPSESEVVKYHVQDRLERSGYGVGANKVKELRVSQHAFIESGADPVIANLGRRVQDVTGLLTYEAEDQSKMQTGTDSLKVLNYGIGGHFLEHYDTYKRHQYLKEEDGLNLKEEWPNPPNHWILSGERMASWIYIIKAPIVGGSTVFPRARVAAKPTTGAALFWYNTKRNGKVFLSCEHGGCPVLLGHKWIANKWVRENAQFLKRPCSLDPKA